MNTHADKTQENKSQSAANVVSQKQNGDESAFQFVDNRPEAVAQRKLQEMANNSPRVMQLKAIQEMDNNSPQAKQATQLQAMMNKNSVHQRHPIQKKENNTGLPDNLKSGIENLSGYSMDDVKVHYNSYKPAQLQAHAYAQGTDIHLASRQEKHLPHEAWHVVQHKQGRVKPTMQMKGKVDVNDDVGMEKEADVMGDKALTGGVINDIGESRNLVQTFAIAQLKLNTSLQVIQRSAIGDINTLLAKKLPNHKERKGRFKVSARLDNVNKELAKNDLSNEDKIRYQTYKIILTSGQSFDAMVQAHELAKQADIKELRLLLPSEDQVKYLLSLENDDRAKQSVEVAKNHSADKLGKERTHTGKDKQKALIQKMRNASVTFNFDYKTTKNWEKAEMMNSFEVLKEYNVMAGNLKDNVDTRDEIENEQFGIPKGMDNNIAKIHTDKEKAQKLNEKIPPTLRPKYAALNFAGYNQGAAPSKYYGNSHMVFKKSIKERCTITGGDSLGEAGGFAGLAFPLTDEGIEGLVEYCSRLDAKGTEWFSLETGGQDDIDTNIENANNPDWNFVEVQIHGDVKYKNEVEKIVIASSEITDGSKQHAIDHIKKITEVQNVVVE